MTGLAKVSIKLALGALILVMGTTATLLSGHEAFESWARRQAAIFIRDTARTAAELSRDAAAVRQERSVILQMLSAEGLARPADIALAARHRAVSEEAHAESLLGLRSTRLEGLDDLVDRMRGAQEAVARLRRGADAAISQEKARRDPTLVETLLPLTGTYVDAVSAIGQRLEATLKPTDPWIGQFLAAKQQGWAVRAALGNVSAPINVALSSGRPLDAAALARTAAANAQVAAGWAMLRDTVQVPGTPPALLATVEAALPAVSGPLAAERDAILATMAAGRMPDLDYPAYRARQLAGLALVEAVPALAIEEMLARAEGRLAGANRWLGLMLAVLATSFALCLGGFLFVLRRVTGPLEAMAGTMRRLAEGDLAAEVPHGGRGDEIGAMAAAVLVFRENGRAAVAAAAAGEAARAAKERRAEALAGLLRGFEGRMGEMTALLSAASSEMEGTARGMSATADGARGRAGAVAEAADAASGDVQAVASAAEELSASIREISR